MRSLISLVSCVALVIAAACATTSQERRAAESSSMTLCPTEHISLAQWSGPHGGVPPFDKVQVARFKPELEAAMDAARCEIAAIAGSESSPTFENTIAAFERATRAYDNVGAIYRVWSSSMSGPGSSLSTPANRTKTRPTTCRMSDARTLDKCRCAW